MGNFDFECAGCEDERECSEYFDMRVRITALTKHKKMVVLEGTYDGYGCVIVGKMRFWPIQFSDYFECWGEKDTFVSEDIYCRKCMYRLNVTSSVEYSDTDFISALSLSAGEEPSAQVEEPATPQPAPQPEKKPASKMLKAELVAEVEQLRSEVNQLQNYKKCFPEIEKEVESLREQLDEAKETIKKARNILYEYC